MANSSDIAQSDLAELLAILGMGDHSRPQSPHEVFQEALGVLRKRLAATGRSAGPGADPTDHLKPCPWEEPHLCCYPKCTCAKDREGEDDREIDRILAMSGDELRAELVAEGHDPDVLARQMKQGLDGTLRLAADRQRWREEAASWRRVAERLQERTNALEAGLKPFAAVLAEGEPVGPIPRGHLDSLITRNNLRLATKLLAASSNPTP